VIPKLPLGLQPCNPFALVTSPRLGLRQVVDIQIKEGLNKSYKIATLKKHLKMEKANKERLLDRLSELSDKAFTLKH